MKRSKRERYVGVKEYYTGITTGCYKLKLYQGARPEVSHALTELTLTQNMEASLTMPMKSEIEDLLLAQLLGLRRTRISNWNSNDTSDS